MFVDPSAGAFILFRVRILTRVIQAVFAPLGDRSRVIIHTLLYGLAGGLGAVAFHFAIHWLYGATFERLAEQSTAVFLVGSFCVITTTAAISGWLLTEFCRAAAGSGIPQLKLAFWRDFGVVEWRVVWVKFLAGALSVGGGSSLGREGPSVHMAGGLASTIAERLGVAKQARRGAAAAGAAAGLAAAFNTPLAAVTFVLEEILEDLNSRLLGRILLAAVVGSLVVHLFIGRQPAFTVGAIAGPTWRGYLLTPLAAALAAVAGGVFQWMALGLRFRTGTQKVMPRWLGPAVGGVATWALGSLVFLHTGHLGVFGLGYTDLSTALTGDLAWTIAAELLIAKLLATALCYGLGGCGGIFSPTLFFGSMSGALVAGSAAWLLPLSVEDRMTLSIVGMVASLAAVVRAPVTGIVIVFEMTRELTLVPALMLGVLVSEAVAKLMNSTSFYHEVLHQDGVHLDQIIPPRDLKRWQRLPSSAIANFSPVIATPENFGEIIAKHQFRRFPFVRDGKVVGVLTRKAGETACHDGTAPELNPVVTCFPDEPIRALQSRILESTAHLLVLVNEPGGQVLGVITLHDLLRAQTTVAELPEV